MKKSQKNKSKKKKKAAKRQRIKRCIKRYSLKINREKWLQLLDILKSYCKQKDYFLCQYNNKKNIGTCHNKFREIRNQLVKKNYVSSYGLQNRGWKLALKDSFETIDRYWAALCAQIRKEIFKLNLKENQRIYLLYAINNRNIFSDILNKTIAAPKSLEITEKEREKSIKSLKKIFKKIVKSKPRVKLYRSFLAEPETYRVFTKNNRQYIALTTKDKGKRIIIPLTGKTKIKGIIRVVFDLEKRRLEIHWVNDSKTKNAIHTEKLGADLGITEVFTDSDGDAWGKEFGKTLTKQSDYLKNKGKKRNKLYALSKNCQREGKNKKAKNILKNNLGKKKLKIKNSKKKINIAQIVNNSLNQFFKDKNPKVFIYEDLSHLRGKAKSKKFSRLVTLWIRSTIRNRLAFKVLERCSLLKLVNAAYSSQICYNCGWVHRGNRSGDKFKCIFCGHTALSDHSAALELLRRDDDPDISLWIPKEQVKSILLKRFRRRLESWNFSFLPSQVHWEPIKTFFGNDIDDIIAKFFSDESKNFNYRSGQDSSFF